MNFYTLKKKSIKASILCNIIIARLLGTDLHKARTNLRNFQPRVTFHIVFF